MARMSTHQVPPSPHAAQPAVRGRRALLAAAVVAVATAAVLAASVVVPYVVNDLHRLPLAEVSSGAHDPKDLWPRGAAGGLLQLVGLLAVALVPLTAAAGAALSAVVVLHHAGDPRDVRGAFAGVLLLLLAATVLVGYLSPLGSALVVWRLD